MKRPVVALTAPCAPGYGWVVDLACDAQGDRAIDVRLEHDGSDCASLLAAHAAAGGERVRYHFPVGGRRDVAHHPDEPHALAGLEATIDSLGGAGERVVTVHLPFGEDIDPGRLSATADRLAELVAYGARRDVTVCLENLRWGVTADPERFAALIEHTGASVSLDVGHANSSEHARAGFSAERLVELMAPRIRNAHVYDREDPHHIAPVTLDRIAPVLDALLATPCDWWVIELFDRDEVAHTRALLGEFLDDRRPR
jgi:sugar phosphate isomerase/epimerase